MAEINYVLLCALMAPIPLLAGCGAGGAMCQTTDYPATPAGAAGTVHVSAGCPAGAADGSAAHPYPTIQQGVDHAQNGDAVLVAPGTYAENVSIAKPVMVVGAPKDSDPDAAPVLVTAPAPYAITVAGGTPAVQLWGLAVVDPVGVGVWVQKSAQATLESVRVEGAKAGSTMFGYGILVDSGAIIVLCRSKVLGSDLAGVLVSGGGGEIMMSKIDDNHGEGGIRVENASGVVSIHDNQIDGNDQVGVGVYSSSATLANNVITNTNAVGMNFGDGVVVAPLSGQMAASSATISGNTIKASGRVGVLFSGGATGSVIGNTITGNGFGAEFAAGIWAQAGAGGPSGEGLSITGNTISGNQYVGVGLTSGARATIANNAAVSDTTAGMVFDGAIQVLIGDGIEVFKGSYAAIMNNTLQGNGRFGIILDSADTSSTVTGNTISGSARFGIVAQNQAAPDLSTDTLAGNTEGPSTVVGMGTFGVQTLDFALP